MLGAIIGDIIGSTYEFNNTRDYNFELFPEGSSYTDDTICTIAIADAILKGIPYKDSLLDWCRRYRNPMGAYGNMFAQWIDADDPKPYNSFGNGAEAIAAITTYLATHHDTDYSRQMVLMLAGAAYPIPTELREKALTYLPEDMKEVIFAFEKKYCKTKV